MKKIILSLCIILMLSLNVTALTVDQITPDNDFIIYSADPDGVAEILKIDNEQLENKIKEQNIKFLAVNKGNTKQIQLTETESEFSNAVGDLSSLSDSNIKSLLPDITGLNNIKGNIVLKDKQKYVNINLKDTASGYILTQYFTVTDKKLYTLSFYTESGVSTDYIETAFKTSDIISDEISINTNAKTVRTVAIIGTVIFGLSFIIILATVIKDLVKKSA
ncbi:MAG: hypothetical protein IJO62_03470 [Clostridia bacterium]|nr:hypothetical protein [Clostridia bacterium]